MANLAKYTEIFGEDFGPIIDALENGLNPNVQAQVLGILDDLTLKADVFGTQVESTVARLSRNGATPNTVRSALKADMASGGKIFGSLKRDVKEGIVEQMNQSGRIGMMEQYANVEKFTWVTVGGHKVCPDCAPRGGTTLTWDQWVSEGLPGSGWSVCGGHCYCILDGSGKLPKEVQVPGNVQEPRAKKAPVIASKYPGKQTFTKYSELKSASAKYWDEGWEPSHVSRRQAYKQYYGGGYEDVNYYARNRRKPVASLNKDRYGDIVGKHEYEAMVADFGNQPGFKGTSYRGTGQRSIADWQQRLKVYEDNVGGVVTEDMFFSSSQNRAFAKSWQSTYEDRKYRIEFTIEGKTGVAPNGLEVKAAEMEVLFNSGTQFEVVSVTTDTGVMSTWGDKIIAESERIYNKVAHVVLKEI